MAGLIAGVGATPDGTTIVQDPATGVLSAPGGGGVTDVTGVAPIESSGGAAPAISILSATASTVGAVQPDNASITIAAGVLTAQEFLTATETLATAQASGATSLFSVIGGFNPLTFPDARAIGKALLLNRAFIITKVVLQSDQGPGGAGNAAIDTFTLMSVAFVPGTPITNASIGVLDSAITAAASGAAAMNATITSFSAGSSVSVPAGTALVWQVVTSGGIASTVQVNAFLQIYGHYV